jgi:hypothetical protein
MIDASLNEVESLAAKAARGAGLSWGLAEEAGRCARWLAACDLPWATSLVALLNEHGALGTSDASKDQRLSPLLTGSYLADLGALSKAIELENLARPLWLLPFTARMAAVGGADVTVAWEAVSVAVRAQGGDIDGDDRALSAAFAERVLVQPLKPAVAPRRACPHLSRSAIRPADWQALETLGAKTYVPASAQSRAKGAGAGLIDND